MSDRVRFLDHQGKKILLMDFSRLDDPSGALPHIAAAKRMVATQPRDSLRTLVDVTGSRFNPDVANALKDLAAHNRPYVIKGSVVGLSGLQKIVYQAVIAFSGRTNLKVFDSREQALVFLVAP